MLAGACAAELSPQPLGSFSSIRHLCIPIQTTVTVNNTAGTAGAAGRCWTDPFHSPEAKQHPGAGLGPEAEVRETNTREPALGGPQIPGQQQVARRSCEPRFGTSSCVHRRSVHVHCVSQVHDSSVNYRRAPVTDELTEPYTVTNSTLLLLASHAGHVPVFVRHMQEPRNPPGTPTPMVTLSGT